MDGCICVYIYTYIYTLTCIYIYVSLSLSITICIHTYFFYGPVFDFKSILLHWLWVWLLRALGSGPWLWGADVTLTAQSCFALEPAKCEAQSLAWRLDPCLLVNVGALIITYTNFLGVPYYNY